MAGGNTRSQVESWGGKAGAHSNHTIDEKDWYNIKIVNTPDNYTVILDDEEVAKVDDDTEGGVGRVGLATWRTVANYDDVVVYGPDGPSLPVDAKSQACNDLGASQVSEIDFNFKHCNNLQRGGSAGLSRYLYTEPF